MRMFANWLGETVSPICRTIATIAVAALSLIAISAQANPLASNAPPGPAFLVGDWEAAVRDGYVLRIAWNPQVGRYEGSLVGQSSSSYAVGFVLGEICWVASPTRNPA